jgi:esterase/lipase superfamily enzyme
MNRQYIKLPSSILGQEMEMLTYGNSGKPMLIFPSQEGRFYDYENFGMIDTLAPFIAMEKIKVYCIDSIDHESWFSKGSYRDRVTKAYDYEKYIAQEVIPFIRNNGHGQAGIIAHGCSFGAFHAANFYLRFPKEFDSGIALSGCYDIGFASPEPDNYDTYYFSPSRFSSSFSVKEIEKLKKNLLIVCAGQGPWEEWNEEAKALVSNLQTENIPAILDLWGFDVSHDWPWWKKMIVYFLDKITNSPTIGSKHRLTPNEIEEIVKSLKK